MTDNGIVNPEPTSNPVATPSDPVATPPIVVKHDQSHADESVLHRLFDWVYDRLKKVFGSSITEWAVKMAAAGIIFSVAVAVTNELIHVIKQPPPACEATKPAESGDGIIVLGESTNDEAAVRSVRNMLVSNLLPEKDFRLIETCRTLRSIEREREVEQKALKGKLNAASGTSPDTPEPAAAANAVIALRRQFNATLVLSVDSKADNQAMIRFWQRANKEETQSFDQYKLDAPGLKRLVENVGDKVIVSSELASIVLGGIVFPVEAKEHPLAPTARTLIERGRRMIEWPSSENTKCEVKLKMAYLEFVSNQIVHSRDNFSRLSDAHCSSAIRIKAHDYRGHTCLTEAMHVAGDTSQLAARIVALQCAEAAYHEVAEGSFSRERDRIELLRSKHNLSYARYELHKAAPAPELLRRARQGQAEVSREIASLGDPSAIADLSNLRIRNANLGVLLGELAPPAAEPPKPPTGSERPAEVARPETRDQPRDQPRDTAQPQVATSKKFKKVTPKGRKGRRR